MRKCGIICITLIAFFCFAIPVFADIMPPVSSDTSDISSTPETSVPSDTSEISSTPETSVSSEISDISPTPETSVSSFENIERIRIAVEMLVYYIIPILAAVVVVYYSIRFFSRHFT